MQISLFIVWPLIFSLLLFSIWNECMQKADRMLCGRKARELSRSGNTLICYTSIQLYVVLLVHAKNTARFWEKPTLQLPSSGHSLPSQKENVHAFLHRLAGEPQDSLWHGVPWDQDSSKHPLLLSGRHDVCMWSSECQCTQDMEAHTCNPSTQVAKARRSHVWEQLEIQSETLVQQNKIKIRVNRIVSCTFTVPYPFFSVFNTFFLFAFFCFCSSCWYFSKNKTIYMYIYYFNTSFIFVKFHCIYSLYMVSC